MAVSFDKELYFTKDLSQYVSYKKPTNNIKISTDVRLACASLYSLNEAPEDVKKAAANFLTFINTISDYTYGGKEYLIDKNDISRAFKFFEVQDLNVGGTKPGPLLESLKNLYAQNSEANHYIAEKHLSYQNKTEILNQPRFKILKEKNWDHNLLFHTLSICGSKIKYPVLLATNTLTDTSDKIVYVPFSNVNKFKKAVESLDKVINYLEGIEAGDKKLLDKILFKNYTIRVDYKVTSKDYQEANFSVSLQALLEDIKNIRKEIFDLHELLKSKDLDFSEFTKKKWTGSLDEEEIFHFGKAFYIIGSGNGGQGFIGLKSIYNRGHANSFVMTIVRDIKNATLFTEGAKYELGYGIVETDRLYVDMEFKSLSSQKSDLAQKLACYIDKNKIIAAIAPEEAQILPGLEVKKKSHKL